SLLPLTLAAQSATEIDLSFTPMNTTGPRTGTLTITPAAGGATTVQLTGSGGSPQIVLGNNALILGSTHVGGASAPQALTITNKGYSDLHVKTLGVTGANPSDFVITAPSLPATVPAMGMLAYQLTFVPQAAGARSATVTIASDDPANQTVSFSVSGSG